MSLERPFRFPLAQGLHARPAAQLRARALAHPARLRLANDRSGRTAELGNLLSLLATDTRMGDPCRFLAEGPGAAEALADLAAFLAEVLEDDLPEPDTGAAGPAIPRILARAGRACFEGLPIAPGLGTGPAVLARTRWPDPGPGGPPAAEALALRRALARVQGALAREAGHGPAERRAILAAQEAMLQDQDWASGLAAAIAAGQGAPAAVAASLTRAMAGLRASENPYLRDRALDLRDLGDRLLTELTGADPGGITLAGPAVLVAAELTPSRLLGLDRAKVLGLVLAGGAGTSHTAILARSFGIPCVVCPEALRVAEGETLTVDGDRGLVVPDPPPELAAYYRIEATERRGRPAGPGALAMALHANILMPQEAAPAFAAGAEGIGLFRTEMLFMDRPGPPSEEEQYQAYRQVLEAAGGRPVVLRLLDVGGDKPLPYLPLAPEANPFLGVRGVRWYGRQPGLIATQLRAAARAARHGQLRLLIPMVTGVEEIRLVRGLLADATRTPLPVGIMVEVPAAAMNLPALAREADFLSVGSNDLVQYLFAADRGDARVARPEHAWHPATLRILARIVADAQGRPLSLCGELAGQTAMLPLLAGLGFTSLSLAPGGLAAARRTLAALDPGRCRELAERALAAESADAVAALLAQGAAGIPAGGLTDPDLVLLDQACASKEEALKLLAERLAALGRARDPLALEAAFWAREASYPTGVGFGFAVPHCKDPAATTPSLAVLRLRQPVDWGAADGQPVDMLVLLATPGAEGDATHLRVFARLARKLMDPTFRTELRRAPGPASILALLHQQVLAP